MGSEEINLTNEPKEIKWFSSSSATDDDVKQCCSTILGNPGAYYNEKKLYTEEQVIDAFRSGVATITDTEIWKRFVSVQKYWGKTVYKEMRNMMVGEIKVFPYDKWSAARVAASKLKSDFECVFRVNKRQRQDKPDEILVERLK